MRSIGAVVLAAGASTRMQGPNKLLLPVAGEPMVRHTVRRVQAAGAEPVVVVIGHEGDAVREALAGLSCHFAVSPNPTGPTSGSLHAGLAALPVTTEGTLVMLADMVHVSTAMLAAVVERLRDPATTLVVSEYDDVQAPPLGFARSLWPELLAWHGEGCGKAVVRAHLHEAVRLAWAPAALADIDTPTDYAALQDQPLTP